MKLETSINETSERNDTLHFRSSWTFGWNMGLPRQSVELQCLLRCPTKHMDENPIPETHRLTQIFQKILLANRHSTRFVRIASSLPYWTQQTSCSLAVIPASPTPSYAHCCPDHFRRGDSAIASVGNLKVLISDLLFWMISYRGALHKMVNNGMVREWRETNAAKILVDQGTWPKSISSDLKYHPSAARSWTAFFRPRGPQTSGRGECLGPSLELVEDRRFQFGFRRRNPAFEKVPVGRLFAPCFPKSTSGWTLRHAFDGLSWLQRSWSLHFVSVTWRSGWNCSHVHPKMLDQCEQIRGNISQMTKSVQVAATRHLVSC